MRKLSSALQLMLAYAKLNLAAQLEYRGAFISQVAAMFINDGVWVIFWVVFFSRFHVLRGWEIKDVITLWSISAAGFGVAHAFFANAISMAGLIARGQLDVWMLYPRTLLFHILLGRMSPPALGDALFGFTVYIVMIKPDLPHLLLFTFLVASVALLFLSFSVLTGSLSFFLGNAEGLSEQLRFAMITFSTYPSVLFEGAVKIVLYTLLPAIFVCHWPIVALREMSLVAAAYVLCGASLFAAGSIIVFYYGLRRYESGNLLEMRG